MLFVDIGDVIMVDIDAMRTMIDSLEKKIYNNEQSFLQRFTTYEYHDLISVSFGVNVVHYKWIDYHSGVTIVNAISYEELIDWMHDND